MGRLTCTCLNVSVHYKGSAWRGRPVSGSVLLRPPPSSGGVLGAEDRLARDELFEVELDVAGATAEHRVLVSVRTVGDWLVHACTNCSTDAYLLHAFKEAGRTFVTGKLLEGQQAAAIATQPGYSHVFRVLLFEREEEEEELISRKRISSMSFGREDPVLKSLHSQMKGFLTGKQEAMEVRIAQFEEDERRTFAQLQQKAHRERSLLFSAIGRARQNILSDAMTEQPVKPKAPPSHPHTLTTTSPKHTSTKPHPSPDEKVTVTLTTFPNKPMAVVVPPTAGTDDTVFSLDGFDEDHGYEEPDVGVAGGVAFPQSDDEEISTDDSSYRDVSALQGIASSVPVGVPMFAHRQEEAAAITNNFSPSDGFQLEDVGNSIKALALSVQDTGMFGDLPRPRIRSYNRFH